MLPDLRRPSAARHAHVCSGLVLRRCPILSRAQSYASWLRFEGIFHLNKQKKLCENLYRKKKTRGINELIDAKMVSNFIRFLIICEMLLREKYGSRKNTYRRKPLYTFSRKGAWEDTPKNQLVQKISKSENCTTFSLEIPKNMKK